MMDEGGGVREVGSIYENTKSRNTVSLISKFEENFQKNCFLIG